jgi:hypothetical protein
MFKPNSQQFTTAIRLQHRVIVDVNGADEISYVSSTDINFCNWKGLGGSESTESGALVVMDTATLTMWFDPSISEKDRILLNDIETLAYEVINAENVEMRNMYLMVKVKRVVSS